MPKRFGTKRRCCRKGQPDIAESPRMRSDTPPKAKAHPPQCVQGTLKVIKWQVRREAECIHRFLPRPSVFFRAEKCAAEYPAETLENRNFLLYFS
jgi:hypothetical protein